MKKSQVNLHRDDVIGIGCTSNTAQVDSRYFIYKLVHKQAAPEVIDIVDLTTDDEEDQDSFTKLVQIEGANDSNQNSSDPFRMDVPLYQNIKPEIANDLASGIPGTSASTSTAYSTGVKAEEKHSTIDKKVFNHETARDIVKSSDFILPNFNNNEIPRKVACEAFSSNEISSNNRSAFAKVNTNGLSSSHSKVHGISARSSTSLNIKESNASPPNRSSLPSTSANINAVPSSSKAIQSKYEIEECDIEYSQQMLLEIKEEMIELDDSHAEFDDIQNEEDAINEPQDAIQDPVHDIDDDIDEDCEKWMYRLSQHVDILEKVKKSTEASKRKSTQLIESMPMVKKRRKSVADKEKPAEKKAAPKPTACETITKLRRKSIDERKGKLSEIAEQEHNKSVATKPKVQRRPSVSRPRVKVSDPRGAFLMQDITAEPKRRMSTSERLSAKKPSTSPKEDSTSNKKDQCNEGKKAPEDPSRKRRPSTVGGMKENQHKVEKSGYAKPSTSKAKQDTLKNNNYSDPLDPFAVRPKDDSSRKPKSFEEVVSTVGEHLIQRTAQKRRMSRLNSVKDIRNNASKQVKSILKGKSSKVKKAMRVQFRSNEELVEKFFFEVLEKESQEILINPNKDDKIETEDDSVQITPKKSESATRRAANSNPTNFQSNPLHKIITEITEWDTDWLLDVQNSPPINGVDFVLMPMLEKYETFEGYQR